MIGCSLETGRCNLPRRQAPFITKLLAEGNSNDRGIIKEEEQKAANMLVIKCPRDHEGRIMYIRAKTIEAMSGKLDLRIFSKFIVRIGGFVEMETMLPRIKMEIERKKK
jgi:hypothetical protein